MSDEVESRENEALEAEETEKEPKRRHRHGFFRRYVLRALMWSVALLAALIWLGGILINTPKSREWARQEIETRVATALDREVTLTAVSFELLPLTVTLEGLRIGGGEGFPEDPFLVLPRAEIEADLEILTRRRLRLRLVKLDRPQINLRFTPHGDNLIGGGEEGGPSELEVLLDRLEIDRGEVRLDDEEIEISFVAEALRARLVGPLRNQLQGDFASRKITLLLPGAEPLELALTGRVAVAAERIDLDATTISGLGLEIETRGGCDWSGRGGQGNKCDFNTRGRAEGEVLARLGYFDAIKGPFDFDGHVAWRGGPIGWRGRVMAPALDLWDFRLENLAGQISADKFGIRLGIGELLYAGGKLRGTVEVDLAAQDDPLKVALDLEGVGFDALMADVGVPVEGVASSVAGHVTFEAPIRNALAGHGQGDLELRVAAGPGLPLEGQAPLHIEGGSLRLGAVSLHSPEQGVLVGGAYDLVHHRGRLSFEVATSNAARLIDLVLGEGAGGGAEPPIWAPQKGIGRASVDLTLEPGTWLAGLEIDLEQVETSRLARSEVRGSFELTPKAVERLRLDIGHADSALTLVGRVPFDSRSEPISLKIDAYSWPIAEVKPWLSFDLPIEGPVSGHLEILLADDKTQGSLDAHISPARLPAQDLLLESLESHLVWDDERLRFHEIEVRTPAGLLRGGGSLTWQDSQLELQLRGTNLDIAAPPLADFSPGPLAGLLTLEVSLAGSIDRPRAKVDAELQKVVLAGRALAGRSHASGQWDGSQLTVEGLLLDSISFKGGGQLDENGSDLAIDVKAGDLGELARLADLDPGFAIGGTLAGRLSMKGPLEAPDLLLELGKTELMLAGRQLAGRSGARIRRQGETWLIENLAFEEAASKSYFDIEGQADPQKGLALDLRSEIGAEWLELVLGPMFEDMELKPYGRLALFGRLAGKTTAPTFEGRAELLGLDLAIPGIEEGLRDLRGTVLFTPGHVDLGRLEGKFAGGEITLSGQADLPKRATLDHPEQLLTYALQVSGRRLGLRRADGWAMAGDVDLTLRSLERGHFLAGRVELTKLDFRRDLRLDVPQLLRDFLRRQRLEVQPVSGMLANVQLNLEVEADKTMRVANNLADLVGSADFNVRGTLAAPLIYGEIAIERGGRLRYNGSDYKIERGRIIFADPFKIDPEFDVVAQTRVREFDISLAVFGNLNRLETRFSSQPPLPDVEVFRLLAEGDFGGEPAQPNLQRGDETTSLSAASFLYGQAASAIGERVSNLFGLDKFRVDPLTGTGGDILSAARVTVGKRLSRRLSVTYSVDPSTTESQRLQVEWRVGEGLVLVLTQNGDNTYSADARWDTSF